MSTHLVNICKKSHGTNDTSGGGRKFDEQSGQMIQKSDQDRSAFALGFQRAIETKSPVAIIAGKLMQ